MSAPEIPVDNDRKTTLIKMALCHERSIRSLNSLSHTQIACHGDYLALPRSGHSLEVWILSDTNREPIVLDGHRRPVTGLCFGSRCESMMLCSGAQDYIILWSVEAAKIASEAGEKCRGQVVCQSPGSIQHLSMDEECRLVAACIAKDVHVINVKQGQTEAVLEGHSGQVNAAEFCPHYTSTLVTISNDRTFKIWGLSSFTLIYQSTIVSSSPFISLSMNPLHNSFVTGTIDGQIRIYDLSEGKDFRCLHQMDVGKVLNKVQLEKAKETAQQTYSNKGPVTISSRPIWQRSGWSGDGQGPSEGPSAETSEVSPSILAMLYARRNQEKMFHQNNSFLSKDDGIVSELLDVAPVLIIATSGAVVELNAQTLDLLSCTSLLDPIPSHGTAASKTVSMAGNVVMARSRINPDKVWCVVAKLFDVELDVLSLWPKESDDASSIGGRCNSVATDGATEAQWWNDGTAEASGSSFISVLSSTPLLPNSILKAELVPKTKEPLPKSKQNKVTVKPGSIDKKGRIVDNQPLTFHAKIKSSGYTATPKKPIFQTKASSLSMKKTASASSSDLTSLNFTSTKKSYPVLNGPPTSLETSIQVSDRPTSISCIQLSERGDRLACALSNTTAPVFNCPLKDTDCHQITFAGHSQMLNHVSWSHDGQWLITSSDDKSAKLWMSSNPEPVMTIANVKGNIAVSKEAGSKPDKENPEYLKVVRFGQFFYVDRFFLLSSGNSFHLYKYHLDTMKSDLKRYVSNTKYKLVKSFQMKSSQQITALSAINSFHSYVVLCTGYDKSLDVFDLNAGSIIQTIPEVHNKPVHSLVQNKGSPFASQASSAYDLFLTSAVSDGIKLWDLRSNRCVRRYEGHLNRIHPCGAAFSPCGRYIATGSEDKCAYIYDIRSGGYLEKLTGHTETVLNVLFHSQYPQLITSTLDGFLKVFSAK